MNIRNAYDADKPYVLDFCKNTFSWGDYISDVWERWKSKGHLYVIEEDGKIVGVYNLSYSESQTWIEGMRIHPDYRRRGLAKKMLYHAESISKVKLFRLIIESQNLPSLQLAGSLGYEIEDKWRLYSSTPQKGPSNTRTAVSLQEVEGLFTSSTYADSWQWLPLDRKTLVDLIYHKRILISSANQKVCAVGIWNRYSDFPNVLQIGYISGSTDGIIDILSHTRNMAHDMGCEKVQVFAQEDLQVKAPFLEKKSLFFLMKKDLTKKNL